MALTYPIAVDEATKALTEEAFELLHDRKNNAHKQEYLIALIPDICLEARNQDDDDDTLLMTAVDKKNRARFVKALIRAGADIETRNKYGRTPLYWRTRVGLHDAVVDALINKGANIYVKNKYDVEINIDALTAEYPLSHSPTAPRPNPLKQFMSFSASPRSSIPKPQSIATPICARYFCMRNGSLKIIPAPLSINFALMER